MRQQNDCRIINEDIAALRNITWAMMDDKTVDSDTRHLACLVSVVAELLLSSDDKTAGGIKELLMFY